MFFNILYMMLVFFLNFSFFQLIFFYIFFVWVFMWALTDISEYCFFYLVINMDVMSFMLSFLTLFIIFFIFLSLYNKKIKLLNLLVLIMMLSLLICFTIDDLLLMYFFFEVSLIPLLVLILTSGVNMERLKASMYLLVYTLLGSFYLLLLLFFLNKNLSIFLKKMSIFSEKTGILFYMIILIFLIKIPMFGVHLWLPKAHVEASVEGSMALAGVLLKLGGYGYYRVIEFLFMMNYYFLNFFLLSLSFLGSLMVMMICYCQVDIKSMIAYSSISHMGMVMFGMLFFSKMGAYGALGMMLGHGFCSSCLFYLGNLFYNNYKTRNMVLLKGMFGLFPMLVNFWLVLNFCNMGVPPFLNFFSEIILVLSILKFSLIFIMLLFIMMLMSVVYGLNLYIRIGHGFNVFTFNMNNILFLDYFIILFHFLFLMIYLWSVDYYFIWI